MSASDVEVALDRLEAALVAHGTAPLPPGIAARLLTAGTQRYFQEWDQADSEPSALQAAAGVPATEVVIAVSAMLRAAGLNSFDLAMWFSRGTRGGTEKF